MNEQYARRAFEKAVTAGIEGLWPATNTRWPLQIDSQGGYEDPHINAAWLGFKVGAVPASWLLLVESFMRSQEGEVSQGAAADMRRGIAQFAVWLTDPFGTLHAAVTEKQQGYVDPRINTDCEFGTPALPAEGTRLLLIQSPNEAGLDGTFTLEEIEQIAAHMRGAAHRVQLQKDLAVLKEAILDLESEYQSKPDLAPREALARIATALQLPQQEGGAR